MQPTKARATALVQGLSALNWHEGSNLRIDWRWAGGDTTLYERYAAELVSLHPDVLLAQGSLPITLLRRHTSTIPIVFTIVADRINRDILPASSLALPPRVTRSLSLKPPSGSESLPNGRGPRT
jgi:putative ABC transport system substrate-binding protein